MADVQLTSTNYNKTNVQTQVSGNYVYYVWQETDGSDTQIWTGRSDLDGDNFSATKQTSTATNRSKPHLQVFSGKVYYVYEELVSGYFALMHAVADLDGSNWAATQLRWQSLHSIYDPQLHIVGTKIYYVWTYRISSSVPGDGLATGYSDLDGSNFNLAYQDSDSNFGVEPPQLQVVDSTIYYVYTKYKTADPYYQIMVATSSLDGSNFSATKKTTSAYNKRGPQFQVCGTKIYYTWAEGTEIWTAIMDTDGSNWAATERDIDAIHSAIYPQLKVLSGYIYYTFDNDNQIASGTMKIGQTDWTYEDKTSRVSNKNEPQIDIVSGEVYRVWSEQISSYYQIWMTTSSLVFTIITDAVSNIKDVYCKGNGTITGDGGYNIVERGFEYGTSEEAQLCVREKGTNLGDGAYTLVIDGLLPETLYYCRAWADNDNEIIYGSWVSLTTTASPSYGVYEEDNAATICFYISEDDGMTWGQKHGPYTTDQADIEITKLLVRGSGKKKIKFESDVLTGISASVMVKLDCKAR